MILVRELGRSTYMICVLLFTILGSKFETLSHT